MATICELKKDILKGDNCDYALKQIVTLYIANYDEVTEAALGEQGNTVATITMKNSAKWYQIQPNKNSASFEDTLGVADGGGKYRIPSVTFSYGGDYNGDGKDTVDALSLGRFMVAAQLSNGTHILFGRLAPMEASVVTLSAAAEATGAQGVTVTLTADSNEAPLPLEDAAVKTIKGIA